MGRNKKANRAVGLFFEAMSSLTSILSRKRARRQSSILPQEEWWNIESLTKRGV
jgi:hypothetical protein